MHTCTCTHTCTHAHAHAHARPHLLLILLAVHNVLDDKGKHKCSHCGDRGDENDHHSFVEAGSHVTAVLECWYDASPFHIDIADRSNLHDDEYMHSLQINRSTDSGGCEWMEFNATICVGDDATGGLRPQRTLQTKRRHWTFIGTTKQASKRNARDPALARAVR